MPIVKPDGAFGIACHLRNGQKTMNGMKMIMKAAFLRAGVVSNKPLDREKVLNYFLEGKEHYKNELIDADREYKLEILGSISEIQSFLFQLISGRFDAETHRVKLKDFRKKKPTITNLGPDAEEKP